jgi:hypothetical protein
MLSGKDAELSMVRDHITQLVRRSSEEHSRQTLFVQAAASRTLANARFRRSEFGEARDEYERIVVAMANPAVASSLSAEQIVLCALSNAAQCCLNLGDPLAALGHCQAAYELPGLAGSALELKITVRMALAQQALGRGLEAIDCATKGIRLGHPPESFARITGVPEDSAQMTAGIHVKAFVALVLRMQNSATELAQLSDVLRRHVLPHADRRDDFGNNLLWAACKNTLATDISSLAVLQLLLEHRASPNQRFESCTPLMFAVATSKVACVAELLHACAGVNHADGDGWTALMYACSPARPKVISELLAIPGLNVSAQNRDGQSALLLACKSGNAEAVRMILDAGAASARDNRGMSALMLAHVRAPAASASQPGGAVVVEMLLDSVQRNGTACEIDEALQEMKLLRWTDALRSVVAAHNTALAALNGTHMNGPEAAAAQEEADVRAWLLRFGMDGMDGDAAGRASAVGGTSNVYEELHRHRPAVQRANEPATCNMQPAADNLRIASCMRGRSGRNIASYALCALLLINSMPDVISSGPGLTPATSAPGLASPLATSVPGLASPLSHLRWDWARPTHTCAGTGRCTGG